MGISRFDFEVVEWFQAHQIAFLYDFLRGVSMLMRAEVCCAIAAVIGLVLIIRTRHRAEAFFLVWGVWIGALVCEGLKLIFRRRRPFQGRFIHSFSFPSNHVFSTTVLCGLLIYLVHRRSPKSTRSLCKIAALWISIVALSRVYLGAHWPTDVIGGALLGGVFVGIWIKIFQKNIS